MPEKGNAGLGVVDRYSLESSKYLFVEN